jgi:hypothetical protein
MDSLAKTPDITISIMLIKKEKLKSTLVGRSKL